MDPRSDDALPADVRAMIVRHAVPSKEPRPAERAASTVLMHTCRDWCPVVDEARAPREGARRRLWLELDFGVFGRELFPRWDARRLWRGLVWFPELIDDRHVPPEHALSPPLVRLMCAAVSVASRHHVVATERRAAPHNGRVDIRFGGFDGVVHVSTVGGTYARIAGGWECALVATPGGFVLPGVRRERPILLGGPMDSFIIHSLVVETDATEVVWHPMYIVSHGMREVLFDFGNQLAVLQRPHDRLSHRLKPRW